MKNTTAWQTRLAALILSGSLIFPFNAEAAKQVLTQSDFTYLGSFLLPQSIGGQFDPGWGRGFAIRYVNGELRAMTMALNPVPPNNAPLYEVRVPNPVIGNNPPTAQLVRNWGDILQGKTSTGVWSFYWDNQDQRLYWTCGDSYNATEADAVSLGYSVLNDATGGVTAFGAWRFTGRGNKATNTCVTPIPQWFADQYTSGRRLGVGCGGYQSVVTTGPGHIGPALAAFNPPNPSVDLPSSSLAHTVLVGYPFNPTAYGPPDRAHRDTDYTTEFDNWYPRNGIGYWSWTDQMEQAGVWIDTPNKSGLVYFPTMSHGVVKYRESSLEADRASHAWYVYDPADLALVAQGAKQQWEIQAKSFWSVQYPGLSYPLPGWRDFPMNMVTGSSYDPTTRHLYLSVRFGGCDGRCHRVHVYQVNDSATPPPPNTSRCDVNANGTTDVNDVQLCANQVIGSTSCSSGDINLDSQCTVVDVQRVVNASLGGQCVSP
jgi:hypothetical protein